MHGSCASMRVWSSGSRSPKVVTPLRASFSVIHSGNRRPLVDAVVAQDRHLLADDRDSVLPRLVLELSELEREHLLAELRARVPGGHERGGDRARGGPYHAPRLPALLLQGAIRPGETDALHPTALEHEVHRSPI